MWPGGLISELLLAGITAPAGFGCCILMLFGVMTDGHQMCSFQPIQVHTKDILKTREGCKERLKRPQKTSLKMFFKKKKTTCTNL